MDTLATSAIAATLVTGSARRGWLMKHFNHASALVEMTVFNSLTAMSEDYTGGYWEFYDLGNGGSYLTPPPGNYRIVVPFGNEFSGTMTEQGAGITACLFAYSNLACQLECDVMTNAYHLLREFALDHPENSNIFRAID